MNGLTSSTKTDEWFDQSFFLNSDSRMPKELYLLFKGNLMKHRGRKKKKGKENENENVKKKIES